MRQAEYAAKMADLHAHHDERLASLRESTAILKAHNDALEASFLVVLKGRVRR